MFDSLGHWGWVAIAWAELLIAYGGYLFYLNWRSRRVRDEDEA